MIRIYVNSFEPGEKPWSVDRGTQETEVTVDRISIIGNRQWITREGPRKDDAPTGWLQCDEDAELAFVETNGRKSAIII